MFVAMKNVSESLAGRVGILSLYSLSHSEITWKKSKPFLNENISFSWLSVMVSSGIVYLLSPYSEIIKSYTNDGIDVRSRFFYYRDNNGKDLIPIDEI